MLYPLDLEPGIGDAEPAGGAEPGEGVGRVETLGAKQTGDEHAGAPDAGVAVSANRLARMDIALETVHDAAEFVDRLGDGMVGYGEPFVVDADFPAELRFGFEAEDSDLVRAEEGDDGRETVFVKGTHGFREMIAAGRTGDDSQARVDPGGGGGKPGSVYPIGGRCRSHSWT